MIGSKSIHWTEHQPKKRKEILLAQTNEMQSIRCLNFVIFRFSQKPNCNFKPRTKHAIHCIDEISFDFQVTICTMEISQCLNKITSANVWCLNESEHENKTGEQTNKIKIKRKSQAQKKIKHRHTRTIQTPKTQLKRFCSPIRGLCGDHDFKYASKTSSILQS